MGYANTKIRIKSPEHSEAFQRAVFAEGVRWLNGSKSVSHLNDKFLFINSDNRLWRGLCGIEAFSASTKREIYFKFTEQEEQMKEGTFDHVEAYRLHCEGVELDWLVTEEDGSESFEFFDQGFFDENWVDIRFRRRPREFEDGAWYPVSVFEPSGFKAVMKYCERREYFICDAGYYKAEDPKLKIGQKLEITWPE